MTTGHPEKGHPACRTLVVGLLVVKNWFFARPIAPVVTTTITINLDVNKIHNCCSENGCQMSRLLLLLLLSYKQIVGARYSQVMQPNILNRDNLLTVIRLPQRSLSSHHLANTNNLTRTTKRQDSRQNTYKCKLTGKQKWPNKQRNTLNKSTPKERADRAWFSRLYDIWPGNGARLFFQPRSLHGAIMYLTPQGHCG